MQTNIGNFVGMILAAIGTPENMIVTNYGFLLGPVIGFMLDIGIGTDKGYKMFGNNFGKWNKFIFSSLVTSNFLRYIITVLLDLFISDPIQDVLKKSVASTVTSMGNPRAGWYSRQLSKNIPSILQSIVGFVTFNAYTNQTRFNWAYADPALERHNKISPYNMALVTALSGCAYLVHHKNTQTGLKTKVFRPAHMNQFKPMAAWNLS